VYQKLHELDAVGNALYSGVGPTAPLWNDPDNTDITSQYVLECVNGGLLKFVLFVAMIVICFKRLGNAIRTLEGVDRSKQLVFWG